MKLTKRFFQGSGALGHTIAELWYLLRQSWAESAGNNKSQQPPNRRLLASVHNIRMPENKKVPFAKYANDTHEDSDTVFVLQNSDTVM